MIDKSNIDCYRINYDPDQWARFAVPGQDDVLLAACRAIKTLCDEVERLEKAHQKLISDVDRCSKMLLTEPDTKGALFKAENILREAMVDARMIGE